MASAILGLKGDTNTYFTWIQATEDILDVDRSVHDHSIVILHFFCLGFVLNLQREIQEL